jgi:hypothetical protein
MIAVFRKSSADYPRCVLWVTANINNLDLLLAESSITTSSTGRSQAFLFLRGKDKYLYHIQRRALAISVVPGFEI